MIYQKCNQSDKLLLEAEPIKIDIKAQEEMNKRLAEFRREFKVKQFKSEQSANNVILGKS